HLVAFAVVFQESSKARGLAVRRPGWLEHPRERLEEGKRKLREIDLSFGGTGQGIRRSLHGRRQAAMAQQRANHFTGIVAAAVHLARRVEFQQWPIVGV